MDITLKQQEQKGKNKSKARILTIVIHALLLLILFVMVKNAPEPESRKNEGIMIAFGSVDPGGGYEQPVQEPVQEVNEVAEPAEVQETQPAPPVTNPAPDVKSTNSDDIALRKKQKADAKAKAKADAEAKAEEERKNKKKNLPGFKTSGDDTTPTNPGDPNSNVVNGGTGQGETGSGANITGRSTVERPAPPKNPGYKGTVVVKICIDKNGNVKTAEATQGGATSTDSAAIALAVKNAKQWKFNTDRNAPEKQCGSITYNFSIK